MIYSSSLSWFIFPAHRRVFMSPTHANTSSEQLICLQQNGLPRLRRKSVTVIDYTQRLTNVDHSPHQPQRWSIHAEIATLAIAANMHPWQCFPPNRPSGCTAALGGFLHFWRNAGFSPFEVFFLGSNRLKG